MLYRSRTILSFFLPAGLTLFSLFALVYFYLLPQQYENLLQQKKELIQGVVDNAERTIRYEYNRFKQGTITEKQAKHNLYKIIEYLRWGPNRSNYLFLLSKDGIILAHPYNPELIGKNINNLPEGRIRSVGEILLSALDRPEHPFVIYYWNKPPGLVISRKLTYVKYFKPWNWVIAGGVYFDDIEQQHDQQKMHTIFFFLAITIVIIILLSIMIHSGLKEEELRTKKEQELRASEQKFRDIYDNTSAFIGLLDAEGRVLDTNRTANDFIKVHPNTINQKKFWDTPWWTHDKKQQEKLRRAYDLAVRHNQTQRFDAWHMGPDGEEILVDFSIKPLLDNESKIRNFIVQGIDVTEQRKTEENLRQSQKLDAIGHLAGGIAHDFNNMLGAILNCADLISLELDNSSPLHEYVDLIITSAENAGKFTHKLLAFSRKDSILSTAIDVHESINDALDILERTIDKNIAIVRHLDAQQSIVIGDPVQIQNTIINLGVNASYAMPDGGTLTIITSNVFLDKKACQDIPFELQTGKYLRIDVLDTGRGISKKHIDRIFEPFFTTKKVGQGTGLGLAIAYGMAKEHHGAISVESKEGQGTRFIIYLPIEVVNINATVHKQTEEFYGHGCVLVIDDEEIIRTTVKGLLHKLGYDVMLAADGQQGIEVYKENQEKIDIVLMDMVMPNMSGSLCFRHLRKLNPDVRVILASGFSQKNRIDKLKKEGIKAFIKKPYRFHQLAQILHNVLNEKNSHK